MSTPSNSQLKKLYQLKVRLDFTRPRGWEAHLRYALLIGGEKVTLQAGTWLLEQGVTRPEDQAEYLYRLPSGEMVALDHPLAAAEAGLITDPQAITAMNAYRTLEEAAGDDWGVYVDHIYHLPPFGLIKCPLCGGTEFVSVDFAAAWCDGCGAQFYVRPTCGDPGFVIDCTWEHCNWGRTYFLLPPSRQFSLRLVFKNSEDPRDMTHCDNEWSWVAKDGCVPGQIKLTGADSSLRPGLHACKIGDMYDWKLGGYAPAHLDISDPAARQWPVDGVSWPRCAYIHVSGLTYDEQRGLAGLLGGLRNHPQTEGFAAWDTDLLDQLVALPRSRPGLGYPCRLPDLAGLNRAQDERCLLHHWLVYTDPDYHDLAAWPVWYVVKPVWTEPDPYGSRRLDGFEVVRRDLCPHCARPVTPAQMATQVEAAARGVSADDEQGWGNPHRNCRRVWELGRWQPFLAAQEAATAGNGRVKCLACGHQFDAPTGKPGLTCPQCGLQTVAPLT